MKVATSRFGEVDIGASSILTFPEGLPGFEGKQFALIERSETPNVEWLQSLSDPAVAVMVLDPARFELGYDPKPKEAELYPVQPDGKLAVRVVVRNGEGPGQIDLNLFAPILINFSKSLAMQVPLVGSGLGVREPWPAPSPR